MSMPGRVIDRVSNARGDSGSASDNQRVNAAGYHGLFGFEKLDFASNVNRQFITISAADVDQLAEKNATGDPQASSHTSNLYVVLDSNDYLDAGAGFAHTPAYGYWLDGHSDAYDRRYTSSVGGDTVNLFVRGSDDSPDFARSLTTASFNATRLTIDFNEPLSSATALNPSEFYGAGVNSVTSATLNPTGATSQLVLTGSFDTSAPLKLAYGGNQITDLGGDSLRYKNMVFGLVDADLIDKSYGVVNYAIFGNGGNDVIRAGSGNDLIVGGAGNDQLTGNLGADTFRTVTRETGNDIITDFDKNQGDKIDLRSLLVDSGFDASVNLSRYLQLQVAGNDLVLRADIDGAAQFNAPEFSYSLTNANVTGNLLGMSLSTLIEQRVILV